ncbi:GtrA family protein [Schaalia sp. lx-260]|uniref:GtrA family protein n=1 Tax=Schaalia sp. lx-260 TaxID=2899082 RepID=UPI001E2D7BCF|nr:GtrA family protein [Schaalia sp. lx-260]MCD4549993.1 GtrA family protein [Schaalia sp. lx-260]
MQKTTGIHSICVSAQTVVHRIARPVRYLASSLSSTAAEYTILLTLNAITGGVFVPVVIARTISCTINYLMNRKVFTSQGSVIRTGIRYAIVAAVVMMLSYTFTNAGVMAGLSLWSASVLTNSSLFIVNYLGQSFLVFGRPYDALDRARTFIKNYSTFIAKVQQQVTQIFACHLPKFSVENTALAHIHLPQAA